LVDDRETPSPTVWQDEGGEPVGVEGEESKIKEQTTVST
jgi:hypothetical protein